MFCKNCGAQMNDNQKFCPNCGTPVQQSETVQTQGNSGQSAGNYAYQQGPAGGYPQGTGQSPKKSSGKMPIIIGVIVGVVVLVAAGVGIIFGLQLFRGSNGAGKTGSTYTDPIDSLVEGMEKQDGEIMLNAFSDGTLKSLEEESGYSRSEIADMLEEMFTSSMGMDVKVGGYQMDFRVDDEEDITGSDLQEIQDQFESAGIDETIEEAKDLEFTLIVGMEDVTDETFEDSMDIQVIKIDGKWYIDPTSM